MKKVITYGTYDLLHQGHINLLKGAKALGDYLVVGVTTTNFDIERGKLNVNQSLMERIKAIEKTGIADEIIIEEYSGQKIDDIKSMQIDIFAIGSDWEGHFDYLNEYCHVVYLPRTQGVSSTQLRSMQRQIALGIYTNSVNSEKFIDEIKYSNGLTLRGIYTTDCSVRKFYKDIVIYNDLPSLKKECNAIYVDVSPKEKYSVIRSCLRDGLHVLSESPITMSAKETKVLFALAKKQNVILFDTLKTGYTTAFNRMISMAKSGDLGKIKDISATCTSLDLKSPWILDKSIGGSMLAWGAYALLPIYQFFGKSYQSLDFKYLLDEQGIDQLTKMSFSYGTAFADARVGIGVKSEGQLIISGTKGYIYVPSPWWKTEYFELRYEDFNQNRRFSYKLEGEGIRNSLSTFMNICYNNSVSVIDKDFSVFVSHVYETLVKQKCSMPFPKI